jgi:hypothetical protein
MSAYVFGEKRQKMQKTSATRIPMRFRFQKTLFSFEAR